MSPLLRRLAVFAFTAGLMTTLLPPAAADESVDRTISGLDELTDRVEMATQRADLWMNAMWEIETAAVVNTVSLNRLERSLTSARVEASAVLEPLIGPALTSAVPAAITNTLINHDMYNLDQRDLSNTLAAWNRFNRAVDTALDLRDLLRERLALPSVTGVRVCPLESIDAFRQDWGDRRGWRTHKGTDINASRGDRLVAVESGVITQMGWHYLGGNQVYLLGNVTGDVYYYAHLSGYADHLDVGVPVLAGQLIGYVGDTGNADVPHLHLGWMPGAERVDLSDLEDPYQLLVELCF